MRARLLLLLTAATAVLPACGDVVAVSPDSAPIELDAEPEPPAIGTVKITVANFFGGDGEPLIDQPVLVVDPEGQVVGETTTDIDGAASIDDVVGGSTLFVFVQLAAALGAPENLTLAIVDVQPGDDIHIDDQQNNGTSLGQMSVLLPARATATNYFVANGCQRATAAVTTVPGLGFSEGCTPDGDATILAWAVNGSGQILSYLQGDATFVNGGNVNLTAEAWIDAAALDVALAAIPPEVSQVDFRSSAAHGGLEFGSTQNMNGLVIDGDQLDISLRTMPSFSDAHLFSLFFAPNQIGFGEQSLEMSLAADTEDLEVAVGEELLPWYGAALYSSGERRIAWTRTAGVAPDIHYLLMLWQEQDDSVHGLYLIGPPDTDEIVLPELPEEYTDRLPVAPAAFELSLYAAESTQVDGYDEARQNGFALVYDDDPLLGLTPPGTVRRSIGAGSDF